MTVRALAAFVLVLCVSVATAQAQPPCTPLAPPQGAVVEVGPAQAGSLRSIVAGAASGTTILLADGTYDLGGGDFADRLSFLTPDVTLRSASGNRDAVVLDGSYGTNEIVEIRASNVTIANLTIRRAYDHPIHVSGKDGAPIEGTLIHGVRITDPGQQAIKINPNGTGAYADRGVIECSILELTDAGRVQVRDNCYTGGVDAHQALGWVVRRNLIQGFWCASGLSEHAVHFWRGSRDTLVEQNVIVDCVRGVGFGLGSSGTARTYPDDPYPDATYLGHVDGIIRNNFIAAADPRLFDSQYGFDTGIGLESARIPLLLHNTVASTETPSSSSIEWRFGDTDAGLGNNLATSRLLARDGASASLQGNLSEVSTTCFEHVASGDLHLTAAATGAVDAGVALPAGLADDDLDGDLRDASPDVGADELADPVFTDGFESGDTDGWDERVG